MENVLNSCTFVGRIAKEPEYSQGNSASGPFEKCKFSIAVDRSMSSQQRQAAQANGQKTCDFIPLSAIGQKVDFIRNWCPIGKAVVVRCHYVTWESVDQSTGQKRYGHNFEVDSIGFGVQDSKNCQQSQGGQSTTPPPTPTSNGFSDPFGDSKASPASAGGGVSQPAPDMGMGGNSSNFQMFDSNKMMF